MSLITCPYTIPAALKQSEVFLGKGCIWNHQNDMQQRFLRIYEIAESECSGIPEIEGVFSRQASEINEFLHEHGFTITLEPFGADAFGMAAVIKALLMWETAGGRGHVFAEEGGMYPGVEMENEVPSFEVLNHRNLIVGIPTQNGDTAYLTMLDAAPADEFAMIETARKFAAERRPKKGTAVTFPMVDLDVQMSLDWLKELWTWPTNPGFPIATIVQALRQTKFSMNELGMKVEEAVAMEGQLESAFFLGHLINRPFLISVERPGLTLPLVVGYITPEDWKDPGKLALS